jgi:Uma2 family endonuclease
MSPATPSAIQWTRQDIEALPDHEGIRYEIIDGELFMRRSPHHKHQHITGCIFAVLNSWSLESGLGEPSIMPGLIFSDADNVAPDVIWISYDRLAQIQDDAGHFRGAPELVVEVLSPGKTNEDRDRLAKLKLYSVQGVQEYWIVDPLVQQISVYRRDQAQLQLVKTWLREDVMASPLLPGFSCAVAQIFTSRA